MWADLLSDNVSLFCFGHFLGRFFFGAIWRLVLIHGTYNSNIVNLVTIHNACVAHWVFKDKLRDLVCQKAKSEIY